MSSCSRKGGKRSRLVLNLRVTIIFFGSIGINTKTLFEMLGIEPGTTSYTLTRKGSFLSLIVRRYEFKVYWYVIYV